MGMERRMTILFSINKSWQKGAILLPELAAIPA
jgi:hypothetical protein